MLDLYTWGTPNGHKVHIMLEECGLPCRIHAVDIHNTEALATQLPGIAVNRKIPVLVDDDVEDADGHAVAISESGAILIYLAEKHGRFLAIHPAERSRAMQWLMFQMSAVGPMMGQCNHFRGRAGMAGGNDAYALARFGAEVRRIHAVMEQHLCGHDYFAGREYSIADMAIAPWLRLSEKLGIAWADHPRLRNWYERIMERPAVQRALQLPSLTTTNSATAKA